MVGDYWVVIPAKDEASRIVDVIIKVKRHTENVIVVDDGSIDNTYKTAVDAGAFEVISSSLNNGKAAAMEVGAFAALLKGAEVIVFIDADGQHDADKIPALVRKLDEGFDMVTGCRDLTKAPWDRKIGTNMIKVALRVLWGIRASDPLSGFRVMTADTFKRVKWDVRKKYCVESDILIGSKKAGLNVAEVTIPTKYVEKHSGITRKDGFKILWNVIWRRLVG